MPEDGICYKILMSFTPSNWHGGLNLNIFLDLEYA